MTLKIVCLCISAVFSAIVITLHFESVRFMVQLFNKQTSNSSYITSNIVPNSVVSSVWCHWNGRRKSCTFQNLCYVPHEKQFIFILSHNSVLSGVKNISDLKTIDLSSVTNHNGFTMKIAVLSPDNLILKRNLITIQYGFILWRFKWDNIMHVIHDDLLPLYTTYKNICAGNVDKCVLKYQVAFADEGEVGPLSEWYNIFSSSKPIILHKGDTNSIICFEEGRIGLISDSVWFQYGFGVPQGPIADMQLDGNQVRQFSEFVLQKFNIPMTESLKSRKVVLFSRKINRMILNEGAVMKAIEDVHKDIYPMGPKLQIFNMDLATNDTRLILSNLLQSQIVLGMHGSAMILTIFLKPGSVIIELFPFGIDPRHVSPVKALCEYPDIGLLYTSWINSREENTVTHPDAPQLLGGISHLSVSEQEQIKSTTRIPAVKCCHNPAYLYRMFQDTIVGSDIDLVLQNAFLKQEAFSVEAFNENNRARMLSRWHFPAPVTNISCSYASEDRLITVTWVPTINAKDPLYQIAVVASTLQFSMNSKTPELKISLPNTVHGDTAVHLWVKCIEQGLESLDTYMQCKVHS